MTEQASSPPERGCFILGVGAQKAGTTWLHAYLAAREDVDCGFTKEYHVFDALTVPDMRHHLRQLERTGGALIARGHPAWAGKAALLRLAFLADPQLYFAYFADLLARPGITHAADITPSYAALSTETLAMIRDEFAARGITVRPVFVMREPVSRLRSQARMDLKARGIAPTPERELAEMRALLGTPHERLRADYVGTVMRLHEVFGDRAHYALFEELFTPEELQRLCAALGLPYRPGPLEERVNALPAAGGLAEEALAGFREAYDAQIRFVMEAFGAERVARAWQLDPRLAA